MKNSRLTIICGFVILFSPLAGQANTADVLVLKNGDRITGVITRIRDGEITIEPAYANAFNVDVPAVAYIESEREFDIDLAEGRELVVTAPGADTDGNQIVKSSSGTESELPGELLELDEPEDDYDWEGLVDFSGDLKKGNTDSSNAKLRADTTFKLGNHRHIGDVTLFREEIDGARTKDQILVNYNYNWLFRDPLFFSALVSYERDPIIELSGRLTASAGIGRDIWATPRRILNFQLGAGVQVEEIGDQSETGTVATWVLRFRQNLLGDELELFHNQSITTNLSGRKNTSYRTSTGLRYAITDLLYAKFSVDYDYETQPVESAKNEDIVMLFGLGLGF